MSDGFAPFIEGLIRAEERDRMGLCPHCLLKDSCDDLIQARLREQTVIKCWNFKSRFGEM